MEFGKHIGKGLWGLAGRSLPSVYGLGIIIFIIRTFPPVEFGVFTILQTIFLLVVALAQSFALQPLVKYGAETDDLAGIVTAAALLYSAFIAAGGVVLLAFAHLIGEFLQSEAVGRLMYYIPLMLVASLPRNLASYILQSKLDLRTLFFLDALYSLSALALIAALVPAGVVTTAEGVLRVNLATLGVSSVFGVYLVLRKYAVRPLLTGEDVRRIWGYGKYSLGGSVTYTIYVQSDNLIISAVLGPVSVAVYNAAKVFTRLFELMHQLIPTLLIPSIARAHTGGRGEDLTVLLEKSLFFFFVLLAVLSLGLILLGPVVMDLVYGDKYPGSIQVLIVLSLTGLFVPAIAVGSSLCHGVGRVRELFHASLFTMAAGILLVFLGARTYGIMGSAWAILLTFVIMAAVWYFVIIPGAGVRLRPGNILGRYRDIVSFVRRIIHNQSENYGR